MNDVISPQTFSVSNNMTGILFKFQFSFHYFNCLNIYIFVLFIEKNNMIN